MIYYIGNKEAGVVKIGYTKANAKVRLSGIQTSNHLDLEILHTHIGCKKLEKSLHKYLKSSNIRGEWFKLDAEVLKSMEMDLKLLDTFPEFTILKTPITLNVPKGCKVKVFSSKREYLKQTDLGETKNIDFYIKELYEEVLENYTKCDYYIVKDNVVTINKELRDNLRNPILDFGKYKGERLIEVIHKDMSYVNWLNKQNWFYNKYAIRISERRNTIEILFSPNSFYAKMSK